MLLIFSIAIYKLHAPYVSYKLLYTFVFRHMKENNKSKIP